MAAMLLTPCRGRRRVIAIESNNGEPLISQLRLSTLYRDTRLDQMKRPPLRARDRAVPIRSWHAKDCRNYFGRQLNGVPSPATPVSELASKMAGSLTHVLSKSKADPYRSDLEDQQAPSGPAHPAPRVSRVLRNNARGRAEKRSSARGPASH